MTKPCTAEDIDADDYAGTPVEELPTIVLALRLQVAGGDHRMPEDVRLLLAEAARRLG